MANYKPVKIMFDLDDEYQLKLYNYLKQRTNGSSYIRTLLHQDIINNGKAQAYIAELSIPDKYEVVNELNINDSEQPITVERNTDMKTASVNQATHHGSIKINVNNKPIQEDDIFVEDLI